MIITAGIMNPRLFLQGKIYESNNEHTGTERRTPGIIQTV